jgi:hypothetical protein
MSVLSATQQTTLFNVLFQNPRNQIRKRSSGPLTNIRASFGVAGRWAAL